MFVRNFFYCALAAGLLLCHPHAFAQHQGHDHSHGHHHQAPHGGTLVVLGDEFAHLELVLDPASGKLTGYVLDGEAQRAIRIPQPEITLYASGGDVGSTATVTLSAVGNPLTGEAKGSTSQFESATGALKGKKQFNFTLHYIDVKGQRFQYVATSFPKGNH